MIHLQSYFDMFVENISLGEKQFGRIESASRTLITYLKDVYKLSDNEVFIQGSCANGTAVRPTDGGDYDVDIVCVSANSADSAEEALDDLLSKLVANGRYAGKAKAKQPCVRIQYADDDIGSFHVDVVPVRPSGTSEAPLESPRREQGWHLTAPNEYTSWCETQGPLFRQTVQMLKRWRDEHQEVRDAIKSIVLQVLIAEYMPLNVTDHSVRVGTTITKMNDALAPLMEAPSVMNPVLNSENLAKRWTADSFQAFQGELASAAELVAKTKAATDYVEAADGWRELFGDDFPGVSKDLYHVRLSDASHAKDPATQGWTYNIDPRYSVRVRAWEQLGKRGRKRPYQSDGDLLFVGKRINFKAEVVAPTAYSTWWRVTNTGSNAREEDGLRGGFLRARNANGKPSADQDDNWEHAAYTGTHLIEVFIVVGTRVVAQSGQFRVNIFNKNCGWRP